MVALESLYLGLASYFHGHPLGFRYGVIILLHCIFVWDVILTLISLEKPEELVFEWRIQA